LLDNCIKTLVDVAEKRIERPSLFMGLRDKINIENKPQRLDIFMGFVEKPSPKSPFSAYDVHHRQTVDTDKALLLSVNHSAL
jgi:hypothetical protein